MDHAYSSGDTSRDRGAGHPRLLDVDAVQLRIRTIRRVRGLWYRTLAQLRPVGPRIRVPNRPGDADGSRRDRRCGPRPSRARSDWPDWPVVAPTARAGPEDRSGTRL